MKLDIAAKDIKLSGTLSLDALCCQGSTAQFAATCHLKSRFASQVDSILLDNFKITSYADVLNLAYKLKAFYSWMISDRTPPRDLPGEEWAACLQMTSLQVKGTCLMPSTVLDAGGKVVLNECSILALPRIRGQFRSLDVEVNSLLTICNDTALGILVSFFLVIRLCDSFNLLY